MSSVQRADIEARVSGEAGIMGLLQSLGLQVHTKGRKIHVLCPFHPDTNPSCEFFDKGAGWCFKCFGCNAGGDVFDFAGRMANIDPASDFPALMEWMGKLLGVAGREGGGPGMTQERRDELERERVAKAKASAAIRERRRADQIAQAVELWNAAVPAGEHARRYLETRGIDWRVLDERARGWDRLWKYHPRVHRTFYQEDGAGELKAVGEEAPALVLGCVNRERKITAVQRIYLNAATGGKIGYGLGAKGDSVLVKATLGSLCGDERDEHGAVYSRGGITCRLTGRSASGLLVICEGADATAPALLAGACAYGPAEAAVWACLSTEGLRAFRLGRDEAAWVREVRIGADFDKSKAGQRAAERAASNLLEQVGGEEWKSWGGHDGVAVRVCMPDAAVSEELVREMMAG